MICALWRFGSSRSRLWSVRQQWFRSSSVSPSEYSRISSRPLQTCRSSWVWLRSSSSPRAPERDWASSGLTWTRNWSSRRLSQLKDREQEMLYIYWMLLYQICVWIRSVGVSHQSWTECNTGNNWSIPAVLISQSCRISCVFVSEWALWMTLDITRQSSAVRCRDSESVFVVRSRAEREEKSSLCWRTESRTAAASCWTSETLQQWSIFSSSSPSTLNTDRH